MRRKDKQEVIMKLKKAICMALTALFTATAFAACGGTDLPDDPDNPVDQTEAFEVYHNVTNFSLNDSNADPFEIKGEGDGTGKMLTVFDEKTPVKIPESKPEKEVDFSNYTYLNDVSSSDFFGTASTIIIYYDKSVSGEKMKAQNAVENIRKKVSNMERLLSTANPDSDISRFNRAGAGETVQIDAITYDAILRTQELFAFTDGAYNPAVSLLVDLWGFSPRFLNFSPESESKPYDRENFRTQLPDQKYIDAFLQLSDYENVKLSQKDGKYFVTKSESSVTVDGVEYTMQIDLGGYGKGLAADIAQEEMKKSGFEYGYSNFGSSSLYLMKAPKMTVENAGAFDFGVSLTYPSPIGSLLGITYGKTYGHDAGVSTSGNYENYYVIDGVEYCHILSPETGAPIRTNICAATIMGGSAADNDALTTALCVMGKEKAIAFVNEKLTDKSVIFVYHREASK